MKRNRLFLLIAAILTVGSLTAPAQDKGYWRASSNSAHSITGDIGLSDLKLMINFAAFDIVHAHDLPSSEISAVFDADSNSTTKGDLYKLNIPAARKFLHKNTLCGAEDTQWLVTYAEGNTLQIAFFSGQKPPVFTLDAIKNSTALCGTFTYTR